MAQPVEFFAYGSLLDQRLMREMVGEWDSLSTARLPDHKLRFSRYSEEWKGATADLEPSRGDLFFGSGSYIKAIAEGMRQHGFAPSIRETLWRWTGSSGTGAP
ncbi:MAG: hypothetical protein DMF49_09625 [Acidobacteria bacterium]|nr:MAG: hypothetical protein DMF49_09625 [Acidobacteriota bacterium]